MVRGKRFKAYVKQSDLERTKAGIEAFRAQKCEQQQSAAQLIAMLREIRQEHRSVYDLLRSRGFNL
jgi:hypothetical protein